MTMMFVSFDEEPAVLRVYGRGEAVSVNSKRGRELIRRMEFKGSGGGEYLRQLILLNVEAVRKSCGYSIPFYKYAGERSALIDYLHNNRPAGLYSRIKTKLCAKKSPKIS
jgi:hypothetical protein